MNVFKILIRNIFLGIAVTIVAVSCKEEDLITYEGDRNLYFNMALVATGMSEQTDSTTLPFAYAKGIIDSVYMLEVAATGAPSSVDRPFKVSVLSSSTAIEGKHYDPLPEYFIMPAKAVSTHIPIVFHKTEDMANSIFLLNLQLEPYGGFKTNMKQGWTRYNHIVSYTMHTIAVTDVITEPKYWMPDYLGAFSRKKILMLCEYVDVSLSDFVDQNITSASLQKAYGQRFDIYLQKEAAAGRTVYEEDGETPMVMGSSLYSAT